METNNAATANANFNNYNSMLSTNGSENTQNSISETPATAANMRNMSSANELSFYGVTLTVWTHADRKRAVALKALKEHREKFKTGVMDSLRSNPALIMNKAATERLGTGRRRSILPWKLSRKASEGDMTASETEGGMSDSDLEGPLGRRALRGIFGGSKASIVESLPEDAAAVFDDGGDVYWMPYAITLGWLVVFGYKNHSLTPRSFSAPNLRCHARLSSTQCTFSLSSCGVH